MISPNSVREILATYQKHGWLLRRVLLSADTNKRFRDESAVIFGRVPIAASDLDAAWFSRPIKTGPIAWEIRYLGDTPFAMLEYLDENGTEFEMTRRAVESRLRDAIVSKRSA